MLHTTIMQLYFIFVSLEATAEASYKPAITHAGKDAKTRPLNM